MPFCRLENIKTATAGTLYMQLDVGAFGPTEKRGGKKTKDWYSLSVACRGATPGSAGALRAQQGHGRVHL